MNQKPTVGRIVQYLRPGSADGVHPSEVSPAIITKVYEDGETCQLTIFNPNGMYMSKIPYAGDGQQKPSHWHWPQTQAAPVKNSPKSHDIPDSIIEAIAKVCHEANRAYCSTHFDLNHTRWSNSSAHIQQSAIDGVKFVIDNLDTIKDSSSHENWMKFKIADGWVYGHEKDSEKKTHPCLVPYEELPPHQIQKDRIFIAIVKSFFV